MFYDSYLKFIILTIDIKNASSEVLPAFSIYLNVFGDVSCYMMFFFYFFVLNNIVLSRDLLQDATANLSTLIELLDVCKNNFH